MATPAEMGSAALDRPSTRLSALMAPKRLVPAFPLASQMAAVDRHLPTTVVLDTLAPLETSAVPSTAAQAVELRSVRPSMVYALLALPLTTESAARMCVLMVRLEHLQTPMALAQLDYLSKMVSAASELLELLYEIIYF